MNYILGVINKTTNKYENIIVVNTKTLIYILV